MNDSIKINELDNETDNESYKFTTNVNKRLSEILEIPPKIYDDNFNWESPKEHGLKNSNAIIPDYYKNSKNKILNIDYYDIIEDDIRNLRPLNEYQMEYIFNLNDKCKNKLLIIFNDCLQFFNDSKILEN